jgi:hypothetical protein
VPTSKEELLRRGLKPHDIQHNQHRRADWQDYGGCGLYMVTFCIEGRHPLFGHIEGDIHARRGTEGFPHIVLSSLGHAILEVELPKIHHFYPQIAVWQAAIMPVFTFFCMFQSPCLMGKSWGMSFVGSRAAVAALGGRREEGSRWRARGLRRLRTMLVSTGLMNWRLRYAAQRRLSF